MKLISDAKAKEIVLRAQKDVFGGNIGDNITTFKGDGLDFCEIREYQDGDDIRKINWKATAKSSNPNDVKVNVFNQERELNIQVVFLASGSMEFGSVKFKQEVATEVLALLSFSALKNNNRLQILFYDDDIIKHYPPSKNDFVVYDSVSSMLELDCLGKSIDYSSLCDYINSTSKAKSLVFLIGDFYDTDIDLSQISHQHEVYTINIRDRFEEYPYISGQYNLKDTNTLDNTNIFMDKSLAQKYQKTVIQNDNIINEHFVNHQIKSGKIYTSDEIYLRLSQIIKDRG
jgi:uncharacterized protein (DUF58 family)